MGATGRVRREEQVKPPLGVRGLGRHPSIGNQSGIGQQSSRFDQHSTAAPSNILHVVKTCRGRELGHDSTKTRFESGPRLALGGARIQSAGG